MWVQLVGGVAAIVIGSMVFLAAAIVAWQTILPTS